MRDSGQLAFLFTDLEGSSQQWQRDATAMSVALRAHDDLMYRKTAEHRGDIIKHLGDGVYAVFDDPADALAASIEIMRELQQPDFSELAEPLRARIGVHVGEAEMRDGDWFGPAVNRAARVMSTGNGNQIVVTERVSRLCDHYTYRDCGTHELRGVGFERLLLLCADDVFTDPRPLRGSHVSNLPIDTNSFVGREDLTATICERLPTSRQVTLVGPGGVGKTRLALRIAERTRHAHPDGVWFCDLDSVTDEAAVAIAVAEIVGVPLVPGRDTAQVIGDHLQRERALIILDNCEHVLAPARHLAEQLVRRAPLCSVLATSRAPLELQSEQIVPVRPFDPGTHGVELLVRRVQERDPAWTFDDTQHEIAVQICERLDGLPLAIELIASRFSLLSPEAILDRIDDRFRLVAAPGQRGRHAALQNTIEWSYDLLTSEQRSLFDRLSVFRGGFTLEAASAVFDPDGDEFDTLDLLAVLVEKSMVQREGQFTSPRFQLLESLREFGARRLAADDLVAETRQRHLQWFATLAGAERTRLFGADERLAWAALNDDWDNIRLAVGHALEQHDLDCAAELITSLHYFAILALRIEALNWSDEWLAQRGATEHARHREVLAVSESAAYFRLDLDGARGITLSLLAEPLTPSCLPMTAIWSLLALGDVAVCEQYLRTLEAMKLDHDLEPIHRLHAAVARVVFAGTLAGDAVQTDAEIIDLRDACTEVGSPSAAAYADMTVGLASVRLDPDRARSCLASAEATSRSISLRHAYIDGVQTGLAQLSASDDDLAAMVDSCLIALESSAEHRFMPRMSHDLQSASVVLARVGQVELGGRMLGASQRENRWAVNQIRAIAGASRRDDLEQWLDAGRSTPLVEAADEALAALRALQADPALIGAGSTP